MDSNLFWLPDYEAVLRRRYRLMKVVKEMANAGRRRIAARLHMPLSQVSKDTEILCTMDYMVTTQGGFSVTREGRSCMQKFEEENPQRIRCMKLEDRLTEFASETEFYVYENMLQVDVQAKRQEQDPLAVFEWKKTAEYSMLESKDACVRAGGLILSDKGKPLYRIEKTEIPERVWLRSQQNVKAVMLYAVMQYFVPKVVILSLEDAEKIYEIYMKEREHHAGCCD